MGAGFRRLQTWGDLADGGGVPAVSLVAVGTLDKDGAVAEALGKNLAADVIQPHPTTCRTEEPQLVSAGRRWGRRSRAYLCVSGSFPPWRSC